MTQKRKESEPSVPAIQKCPNCGHNILIGDNICSNCGLNVQSTTQRLKSQPPMLISATLFGIGLAIAAAATGMENPYKFVALVVGFGLIASGGLYYAADLLILNADDRREKIGGKRDKPWWQWW